MRLENPILTPMRGRMRGDWRRKESERSANCMGPTREQRLTMSERGRWGRRWWKKTRMERRYYSLFGPCHPVWSDYHTRRLPITRPQSPARAFFRPFSPSHLTSRSSSPPNVLTSTFSILLRSVLEAQDQRQLSQRSRSAIVIRTALVRFREPALITCIFVMSLGDTRKNTVSFMS